MNTGRLKFTETCLRTHPVQLLAGGDFSAEETEKALDWQHRWMLEAGRGPAFTFVVPIPPASTPWLRRLLAAFACGSYPWFNLLLWDPEARLAEMDPLPDPRVGAPAAGSPEELWSCLQLAGRVRICDQPDLSKGLESATTRNNWLGLLAPGVRPQPASLCALAQLIPHLDREMICAHGKVVDPDSGRIHGWERIPEEDRYSTLGSNTFGFCPLVRGDRAADLGRRVFNWPRSAADWTAKPWILGLEAVALGANKAFCGLFPWVWECDRRVQTSADSLPGDLSAALGHAAKKLGAETADWKKGRDPRHGPHPIPVPKGVEAGISVIIPFRNQADLTVQALASLSRQEGLGNLEVILVNNDSDDGPLKTITDQAQKLLGKDRFRILDCRGVFNFARLNNEGVRMANEPLLLFINNDIEIPGKDSLRMLASLMQWPEVGMAGPHLLYPDQSLQSAGMKFGEAGPEVLRRGEDRVGLFREVDGMPFAFALCSREAFDAAGGLDERICPNGFGDAVFCHRLRKAGYRILVTPLVEAIHHESVSRGRRPEEVEWLFMDGEGIPVPQGGSDFHPGLKMEYRVSPSSKRAGASWSKRLYRSARAFWHEWSNGK